MPYAPPQQPLSFVYADEEILALSKPSGLLSVPGRTEEKKDCLESRVQKHFPTAKIVHRLDMETSGILLFGLTAETHKALGLQFEKREIKKSYIARVAGQVKQQTGEINLPLRCDWPNRPRQMVDHEQGKAAQTLYEIIEYDQNSNSTRVRLTPITGRSHQLRVHMLSLGHPILGDELYASDKQIKQAQRLQLHAEQLCFHHPRMQKNITLYDPCAF